MNSDPNCELPVDLHWSGNLDAVEPLAEAAIYRLVQESLTNAVRHAHGATKVDIEIRVESDVVRLAIRDDGEARPFDVDTASGFGLVGMAERAHLLGGTFGAGPGPNGGWTVEAVLPRKGGRQ